MTRDRALVAIETALIPAGAFVMDDAAGRPDEQPPHEVYVSAFRMALLPVTNEEYGRFPRATGRERPRFWDDARFNAPSQPVVGVSWSDAVAYCAWLAATTGEGWRLPTDGAGEGGARRPRSGAVPVGRRRRRGGRRAIRAGGAAACRALDAERLRALRHGL